MIVCGALIALFWAAFLAATILPFSSEAALAGALAAGLPKFLCLLAATLGNSLGSCTTFYLGRLGKQTWLTRYCRVQPDEIERTRRRIESYGALAAFLTFLPLAGDLFAIALGFMRYPVWRFVVLMTAGKALRYAVILWIWNRLA